MPPRSYRLAPTPVTGYPIDGKWSVVMPPTSAATNIHGNPSIEKDTTGYTAIGGSIARVITKQRRGAYSLQVTPGAGLNDGVFYGTIITALGQPYPWSFDFWGDAGRVYKAYWGTTLGAQLSAAVTITAKGRWQRIQVPWIENANPSASRRLYVVKTNSTNVRPFYLDGMLVLSGGGDFEEWRYFDGDSQGFIPGQTDFYWNGTPHGSTSTMKANSRAGGRIIPLARYGFTLLAMFGLGMSTPNNIAVPLALPGGEQYQRTLSPATDFTLAGFVTGKGNLDLRSKQRSLAGLLDVRRQPVTQNLLLQYEPTDECGEVNGERVEVKCSFAGGLEGQWDNHYQENLALKFRVHLPYVANVAGTAGAQLDVADAFTAGYIVRRSPDGIWGPLSTAGLGNTVTALLPLPDGRWLIGGTFLNAGGDANADFLVYYDPVSNSFTAVNATPLNNAVTSLLLLPDGNVAVGGVFANAGGDANADALCLLTVATGVYSSFNATPLNNLVNALELLPTGDIAVGGQFTNFGPYLVKLTRSTGAFSAFSGTALSDYVSALEVTTWGDLYIGGNFQNVGGFAEQDYLTMLRSPYTSFSRLTGNTALSAAVSVIKQLSDGSLLIGGTFVDVNGDTTWDYLLRSIQAPGSGSTIPLIWSKPFSSISNNVASIAEAQPGVNLVGGTFASVAGIALFDGVFQYSGTTLIPLDLDLPGAVTVQVIAGRPSGEVIMGILTTGTAYTSGTTTITNTGTAPAKPIIVIKHPTTAALNAPLYSIRNLTTGKVISFNLSLLLGETLTIDLAAGKITSDLRGNMLSTVLPGSNFDSFFLVPGPNTINIFSSLSAGSLPSAYIYFTPTLAGVTDAVP